MKPFEDKAFENVPEQDEAALQLGSFLRENYKAPPLPNPDFFNHQLMQRIEAEKRTVEKKPTRFFWRLPRLAWAGGFCMGMVALIYGFAVPKSPYSSNVGSVAEILNTQIDDPAITSTLFHSNDHKLTVLWLEGWDSLPVNTLEGGKPENDRGASLEGFDYFREETGS